MTFQQIEIETGDSNKRFMYSTGMGRLLIPGPSLINSTFTKNELVQTENWMDSRMSNQLAQCAILISPPPTAVRCVQIQSMKN